MGFGIVGVEETGKNHGRTDKLHNVTIGCATGTVVVLAVMIALTAIICLIRKNYECSVACAVVQFNYIHNCLCNTVPGSMCGNLPCNICKSCI